MRKRLPFITICKLILPYGLQSVDYISTSTSLKNTFMEKIDKTTRKHIYILLGFKETTKEAINEPFPTGLNIPKIKDIHQLSFITNYIKILNGPDTLAKQITLTNHFLIAGRWNKKPILPKLD